MDKKQKPPPQGQQPMYPGIPGMPPGMMPPNTGGKPMVVVVMKGGGQPNLSGLPFMMGGAPPPQAGGKKKKKKGSKGGKKKAKKSGEKPKTKKSGEEDSDSDSDRVNAPDIPAAHTHKPPPGAASPSPSVTASSTSHVTSSGRGGVKGGNKTATPANPMASAFGSGSNEGGGGGANPSTTSTTSTTSAAGAAAAGGGAGGAPAAAGAAKGKAPAKKPAVKKAPAKPGIKKETFVIKDGNVDKSCVPAFVLVEGPAGCPIAVPIDARDENAVVNELGPQPLTTAPKETVRGYLLLNEEGMLYFKPQKECKEAPFASTPGQLQKFLANTNIFIADAGPQLPDEKAYNKASTVTKDKIGGKDIAVSGHVTTVTDKGTCKFTRVVITQSFPFYPHNAAFGVLVRDFSNGYVFFVPTENRFVGMVLSQGVKQPFKPVVEAQIVGNIYKDANGAAIWEVPSEKKDNLMGYIMSSGTGVPIYVPKPDDNVQQRAPAPPKKGKAAVTPGASSITASTTSPASPVAAGASAPTDGTASTTAPVPAGQPGEAGGVVKVVESVTCLNPGQGTGGATSMTVPIAGASDPAAAAAAGAEGAAAPAAGGEEKKEGEGMQDQLKKMVASQQELPPVPEQPAEAAAPKEEEKKEEKQEEEAPPPPPPAPKKPAMSETNREYKKFLDDRSTFL